MEEEILKKLEEIKSYSLLAAKEMLSVTDMALLTGFKQSYVRKMAEEGLIPYYKPFGKQLFFKKSEVNEILATHHVPSIQELIKDRI